jgi:hypothetical protein
MLKLGQNLLQVERTWSSMKDILAKKYLRLQYDETDNLYNIFAIEENVIHTCVIWKVTDGINGIPETNSADKTDFETNYKNYSNYSLEPRTSDGKLINLNSIFPSGLHYYESGCGDGAGYGNGTAIQFSSSQEEVKTLEVNFNDWVYLGGGRVLYSGAVLGDYFSMEIYGPASTVTPNGGNTGNCNIVNHMIVPAAGNGAYDVDLSASTPIPAYDEETGIKVGYWNWSNPDSGKGTITAGTPGASEWYLFDVDISMSRPQNKINIIGAGNFEALVPIKSKKILPHWKMKFYVNHTAGTHNLYVAASLLTARKKTV